jgi:hypothetical protein
MRCRCDSLSDRVIALLPRFMIIGTHTTVGLILSQVPFIGAPISLMITCLVDAYYCFEYGLFSINRLSRVELNLEIAPDQASRLEVTRYMQSEDTSWMADSLIS